MTLFQGKTEKLKKLTAEKLFKSNLLSYHSRIQRGIRPLLITRKTGANLQLHTFSQGSIEIGWSHTKPGYKISSKNSKISLHETNTI